MSLDHFQGLAEDYEQNMARVDNVDNIARAIRAKVVLNKTMSIMDFGSGTGLLLERIAPYVRKITAVDVSRSMNQQLTVKLERISCDVEIMEVDLEATDVDQKFDGIISSMTMHHVRDTAAMLQKFFHMLHDDGFIAIADLDSEDGSFHTHDTGVHHHGFDREMLTQAASGAGFNQVEITGASTVHKPQGDYQVFLLTGYR